jgi:ABC-type branched-subunit amino acid transport system substrate-binding protein
LLLPEPNPAKLKSIAALLPGYEMDQAKVRLLGTSVWDTPNLGAEPALVGGWYASTPPDARAGFERRFEQAYGRKPQRLAALAYDAVGVAAVLQRTPDAGFSAQALTNPSGFAGADGIFRLTPDGLNEHGLAVLEVERGAPTVLSPAPETFQPTGQ